MGGRAYLGSHVDAHGHLSSFGSECNLGLRRKKASGLICELLAERLRVVHLKRWGDWVDWGDEDSFVRKPAK